MRIYQKIIKFIGFLILLISIFLLNGCLTEDSSSKNDIKDNKISYTELAKLNRLPAESSMINTERDCILIKEQAHKNKVLSGLDVLLTSENYFKLLKNKNIALVTNQTGINADGIANFQVLTNAGILIKKIFAPEHGYEATNSNLPVITLHGQIYKPTPDMLNDIDIILFDIQDVGARFYTYISTMAYCMEAAKENNKLFVVLDRPNPIGGNLVQGNILEPAYSSFIGLYPIPIRHGMTIGELAKMFNEEYNINCELIVIPCKNWRREMWFDDTGLPWIKPSPAMVTLDTATSYPGTCFFEGTNLSMGRGTKKPFEQIGAPWLDSKVILNNLKDKNLPGVILKKVDFIPQNSSDGKYDGEICYGVFLEVTDRNKYDPVKVSLYLIESIKNTHPSSFTWNSSHFDLLLGTNKVREQINNGIPVEDIIEKWEYSLENFKEIRKKYLIYP